MNISEIMSVLLPAYEKENPDLFLQIKERVEGEANWDKGINPETEGLTIMLLYEYSTAIETMTNGKISAVEVIDKLSSQMGTFRFGDFVGC